DAVYDRFRAAVLARADALKVGSGDDDDCGPVISRQSLERLTCALAGAEQRGARVARGGQRVDDLAPGCYWQPRIRENGSQDDEISQHELFGPVTCLYRVQNFEEAVTLANATSYGLTGAIHTANTHRIEEFVARYRAGLVSINGPTYGSG